MKTQIKRTLCVFFAVIFVLTVSLPALAKQGETKTIDVFIRGKYYYILYELGLTLEDVETCADVFTALNDEYPELDIKGIENDYITSVEGENAGFFGGWDGWMFRVNGVEASQGIKETAIEDGDTLYLYYADPFGAGSQYPEIHDEELCVNGKLSFTSKDTDWSTGEPVVTENPVVGATVTLYDTYLDDDGTYYANNILAYLTTDKDGAISIPISFLDNGKYGIFIERYASNGAPTVVSRLFLETVRGPFDDVSINKWYSNAVIWGGKNNVISGMTENTFGVGVSMSRAMLVTVLGRYLNVDVDAYKERTNKFTDVKDGAWYADYVEWAYRTEVTSGVSETLFAPDSPVTRQQAAAYIYRVFGHSAPADRTVLDKFADKDKIADWAADAVAWAVENKILSGTGANFEPTAVMTREQAVQMLYAVSNAFIPV